ADRKAGLTEQASRLGVPISALVPAFEQLDAELRKVARSGEMAQAAMEFEQAANASKRSTQQAGDALKDLYAAMERVPDRQRSELERLAEVGEALRLAEIDLQIQVARGIITDQQAAVAADDLAAARQRLAKATTDAKLNVATSLVQGVAGGPAGAITAGMSAVGAGAPMVGLVGAGLGLAAAAGQPGADFSKQFQQQMDAILRGLLKLPAELVQIAAGLIGDLPMILADGLPAFTQALVEAGAELLQVILDPRMWVQVAEAIVTGLLRSIGVVAMAIVKGLATLATVDFWRSVGRAFIDALVDLINIFDGDGRDRRQERRDRRQERRDRRQEERQEARQGQGGQRFASGGDRPRGRSASGPGGGREAPQVQVQVLGSMLGSRRDLAREVAEAQRLGYRTSWER
ncbi:MAG: hypothetical protein EBR33_12765, partial [Synechococcaceae bacterium WB4_1_0192]|nr:hypothetical protein [Synechococcaceae bacterium WB4_1_0192]